MLRQVRQVSLLALVLAACTKEATPPPAPPAEKKTEEKNYELSMTPPALKAGLESSAATITVTAISGFHVNP